MFATMIKPVCRSIIYRFQTGGNLSEIIRDREDLREDLGEKSLMWLAAINLCDIVGHMALEDKVISILSNMQGDSEKSQVGCSFCNFKKKKAL